jgi:hippurate hydrolase
MVEEGLFERWPVGMVFGLHNWPGLPFGQIAVQPGPIMAAMDLFSITITGAGVHAAQPHLGTDTIVAAGALINALQTIASRAVDPMQPVVVSLTQIHGGHSLNALPGEVKLQGTVRSFAEETRVTVKRRMEEIIAGIAATHSVKASLNFIPRYPATVNDPEAAMCACHAATAVNGPAPVLTSFKPSMTSEDFAFMLNAKAGCYVWLGDGGQTPLHSPYFDFNDDLIPLGASYFVTLARTWLSDARQHGAST